MASALVSLSTSSTMFLPSSQNSSPIPPSKEVEPRQMPRIRGLKWKRVEKGAQITVPASSVSAQEIMGLLDNRPGLVDDYSIRLRADVYKVTIESQDVGRVQVCGLPWIPELKELNNLKEVFKTYQN